MKEVKDDEDGDEYELKDEKEEEGETEEEDATENVCEGT